MSKSRKILVVNTNTDSADAGNTENTLRWALSQTQRRPGKYEIVFQRNDTSAYSNGPLKTGYWTFELERPLPALNISDIRINTSVPKSIILVPKNRDIKNKIFRGKVDQFSAPLLTIGDPYWPDSVREWNRVWLQQIYGTHPSYGFYMPKVLLNEINFARNIVQGQDGANAKSGYGGGGGGGGGLAAGAGVLLGEGKLHIKDAVFQDLLVIGGNGGKGAAGARGADTGGKGLGLFGSAAWPKDGENGSSGGAAGGLGAGIPVKRRLSNLGYDESKKRLLPGPVGGKGGKAGEKARWHPELAMLWVRDKLPNQ